MSARADSQYSIRSFKPADLPACKQLYTEGLLTGSLPPNDTGYDIDDIAGVYLSRPENHFWVAHLEGGEVVGMLGVQHHEKGIGEIRRLRVAKGHRRRGIGSALLETALHFCQAHGDVKVTLDTVMDRLVAVEIFAKFHFKHQNSKRIGEKDVLYFYLDLYASLKKPKEAP
jgi:GNAT superfamily N-acetyltransferase